MPGINDLLGEKLLKGSETVETSTLVSENVVFGLYFSAHWCPPCRGFTPKLAEWYNNFKASDKGSKLEMVFVSSDRDEASFQEYFAEMPWHGLPFEDRDRKGKLSKKFKVNGIPTLVFVDATSGKTICKDGRSAITNDPEGKDFPWEPKELSTVLSGPVQSKDGEKDFAAATEGKTIGLYFSAHWCGPCRSFTPSLVESYNKLKSAGKPFEIVFVTWDDSEESYEDYFKDMPWLSFPHDDPRIKALNAHFEVDGIPSLVLLDENKKLITKSGRGAIGSDPEGEDFPWIPKALDELTPANAGGINESAHLLYLTGGKEEEIEKAKSVMSETATKYVAEQKASQDGDSEIPELYFMYEGPKTKDMAANLKEFLNLSGEDPFLVLLDIGEQRKYVCENKSITEADIKDIVAKFKAETLDFQPVR